MASMQNFRPELWTKFLTVKRERESVFESITYKGKLLGDITEKGDKLHIVGIGRPTVRNYTEEQDLTREYLKDTNQELIISQAKYFDFALDRVAEKQAEGSIMGTQMTEARRALAETQDEYLAGFFTEAGATVTAATLTSGNIVSKVAEAYEKLLEANVKSSTPVCLVIDPKVYTKLTLAKVIYGQPNDKTLRQGFRGMFLDFEVYVSNSLTTYSSSGKYCFAMTKECLAFAEQISDIESYPIEKGFGRGVKGLHLYGATVYRPDDMVSLEFKTAAETAV